MQAIAELMVATPLLGDVPAEAILWPRDVRARVRNYRKGTYVCHQGDPADEVFFLFGGRVEISAR